MDINKKDYLKHFKKNWYDSFVLAGDIGGTNANLGFAGVKDDKPTLIFSTHSPSKDNHDLVPFINETLKIASEEYDIDVKHCCLAVAGPVSVYHDKCFLTNAKFWVDAHYILESTMLESVLLINDFEAVAYAINLLDVNNPKQILKVRHFDVPVDQPRLAVGAGTGLGKSLLVYDSLLKTHIPVSGESGRTDFPVHDDEEMAMMKFIKEKKGSNFPVVYEDFLSGRGIANIYDYLSTKFEPTEKSEEINSAESKQVLITKYRTEDKICKETFKIFTKFYARIIRNFALNDLARGGIYIGGGIAANNSELFQSKEFFDEFENNEVYVDILNQTPIYVIIDYDLSLIGSSFAAIKRQDIAVKK